MKPIITVEFTANVGDQQVTEETVPLHNIEELFAFVAPGGGCDKIPDDAEEIRMIYLPPEHKNKDNPVADLPVTLQIHRVLFNGPLAEVTQTLQQLIDKAGRGELSDSFRTVIGIH
jgi:hypothetical protein